jgi:hypothetical protein
VSVITWSAYESPIRVWLVLLKCWSGGCDLELELRETMGARCNASFVREVNVAGLWQVVGIRTQAVGI